jgi:RNase P/RNase MRP subunit POP5
VGTAGDYVQVETDAKGRVIAGVPYRRLYLTKNGTQSLANTTNANVTPWTSVENTGGFSQTGGVVTVDNAGNYNITVAISFASNTSGTRAVFLAFSGGRSVRVTNPANTASAQVSTVVASLNSVPMAAGETITIQARQTAGTSINIAAAPDTFIAIQSC